MRTLILLLLLIGVALPAQEQAIKPAAATLEAYQLAKAPAPSGLVLKTGDRLAICGDSITEQKMYSRIMETYLAACVPQLEISVRQYGWSGETAPGFLSRMTNDCLRFKPTIATTCYGMNDHGYRPYEPAIGERYRKSSTAIVQAFKGAGSRVIQGSPGCVGTKNQPNWDAAGVEAKNKNLAQLRNLGIEIAAQEGVGFADVFAPMLQAGVDGRAKYGAGFNIAGGDGVHPGWAGSASMAYSFLKAFGLDGQVGTLTLDLDSGKATASDGHEVVSAKPGEATVKSQRYPFCATGDIAKDNNIRSLMTLVPFNQDLNRLMLVAKGGNGQRYKVTWGAESKMYTAGQLAAGVNLAADFPANPFGDAFAKVDAAVAAKQAYETKQIKQIFHDLASGRYKTVDEVKDPEMKALFAARKPDGKFDRDAIAAATEKTRAPLAAAVRAAVVPVTHTIRITAE